MMGKLAHKPVRLAMIGAGIYARDAHVPSLRRLGDRFEVVAVYSRTRETAASLADQLPGDVAVYTDLPALVAREDIEAFDILLPIGVMGDVVEKVLATGKHLISEKPIAAHTEQGRRLMEMHARNAGQIWMVGENWRYESAFRQAAELVRAGAIGEPMTCHWAIHSAITPASKYYDSQWRRGDGFSGGWLLDGGVHHIAVLRAVMGEVEAVTATSTQMDEALPPADTMSATLRFASGALGTYLVTYAASAFWESYFHVAGANGSLQVQRGEINLHSEGRVESIVTEKFDGVQCELAAFSDAIRDGVEHLNSPAEALQDLAVIEAMLRSAESGASVEPARHI